MSLVERQIAEFESLLDSLTESKALRKLEAPPQKWPQNRSLVLSDQVAIELGNPSVGDLGTLLWTDKTCKYPGIWLAGDDLDNLEGSIAFGQILLVSGRFDDEYEHFLDLHDALHDFWIEDVTARSMPVNAKFWYRVSKKAQKKGFSLAHLGQTIVGQFLELEGIDEVTLLFVTDARLFETFRSLCDESIRIAGAMIKRKEEREHECDSCDFSDICVEGAAS